MLLQMRDGAMAATQMLDASRHTDVGSRQELLAKQDEAVLP